MSKNNIPTKEGFFWGRLHAVSPEGSADEVGDEWEVHHVVQNSDDPDDEYLMAMVPGMAEWQPLTNFEWGPEVTMFQPCDEGSFNPAKDSFETAVQMSAVINQRDNNGE